MSRGFGKKADMALEAPLLKAGHLHKAMQSIGDTSDLKVAEVSVQKDELPSKDDASAGADILSQWSKAHDKTEVAKATPAVSKEQIKMPAENPITESAQDMHTTLKQLHQ